MTDEGAKILAAAIEKLADAIRGVSEDDEAIGYLTPEERRAAQTEWNERRAAALDRMEELGRLNFTPPR